MSRFLAAAPILAIQPVDAFLGRTGSYAAPPPATGRIEVLVRARHAGAGQPALEYKPPVRMKLARNHTGVLISFNHAIASNGVEYGPYFEPGEYDILIRSDRYRPMVMEKVVFAGGAETIDKVPLRAELEPGFNYPFPAGRTPGGQRGPTLIRGVIEAGASDENDFVVEASPAKGSLPYRVLASGQWVLVFPSETKDGQTSIKITDSDGRKKTFSKVPIKAGATTNAPEYRP